MDQNQNMPGGKVCKCPHHKVKPFGVALIGLVFLLAGFNALTIQTGSILIGILLIIVGLSRAFAHKCGCCNNP